MQVYFKLYESPSGASIFFTQRSVFFAYFKIKSKLGEKGGCVTLVCIYLHFKHSGMSDATKSKKKKKRKIKWNKQTPQQTTTTIKNQVGVDRTEIMNSDEDIMMSSRKITCLMLFAVNSNYDELCFWCTQKN